VSDKDTEIEKLKAKVQELEQQLEAKEKEIRHYKALWNSLPENVRYTHEHISEQWILTLRNLKHIAGLLLRVEWKPERYYIGSVRKLYVPELGGWRYVSAITDIEASAVIDKNLVVELKTPEEYEIGRDISEEEVETE